MSVQPARCPNTAPEHQMPFDRSLGRLLSAADERQFISPHYEVETFRRALWRRKAASSAAFPTP